MPLSTKDLINNIPKEPDARNARYVHVFSKKNLGPAHHLYTTITKIPGDFVRKHKIWLRDQDGQDVMTSKKIWVSCDCDRFQYTWEYALWKKGASSIRFSNGEPAVERNPRNYAAGCKHIYRCLADLAKQKRRGSNAPVIRPSRSTKPIPKSVRPKDGQAENPTTTNPRTPRRS